MLKVTKRSSKQGWILLEILFSLVLFTLILAVIQQQIQEHSQSLLQLERNHQIRFQQSQIRRLQSMKQSSTWLANIEKSPSLATRPLACITCQENELEVWVASWLVGVDITE